MAGDRRSCILVELTDGPMWAFDYPDEESAEGWYGECRKEWNAGHNVIFYVRPRNRFGTSDQLYGGNEVAHIELTTGDDARARGADRQDAYVFG